VVQPPDLARDVPVNVVHEGSQLLGRLGRQQQMSMVAQEDQVVDPHPVLPLGATDDADDQVIGARARAQEEPAVEGAHGDLDERAGREEAQGARHVRHRRRIVANPCGPAITK
jgi:hypothetical protein